MAVADPDTLAQKASWEQESLLARSILSAQSSQEVQLIILQYGG